MLARCRRCPAACPGGFCAPIDEVEEILSPHASMRRLSRNRVLMLENTSTSHVHVVRQGVVAAFKSTEDGREQVIAYRGPGGICGLECLTGDPAPYSVQVIRPCEVCSIPLLAIRRVLAERSTLATHIISTRTRSLVRAHKRLLDLGVKTAREKVATFLCDQIQELADEAPPTDLLLRFSRREIAACLGLSNETVIRLFTEMHRDGVVQLEGRHVRVLQPAVLSDLAGASL
jgi:CRP/FNR family transcriptional regulator